MAEKIVMKIGGSVIARKDVKDFPLNVEEIKEKSDDFIRHDVISRIGKEIRKASGEIEFEMVLINGAGPFGHFLVKYGSPDDDVRESVKFLNSKFISNISTIGKDLVQLPPHLKCDFREGVFDIYGLWEDCKKCLLNNHIPSTYGDMLRVGKVISGDDIMAKLAGMWGADKIIAVTDVDGVFTKDPKLYPEAEFMPVLNDESVNYNINNVDVTGGMRTKVEKMKSVVKAECRIVNGMKEDEVREAILGEEVGTLIR